MARLELTENMRRMRQAEQRDPVDNAVYALAALRSDGRKAAIAKFNAIFERVPSVPVIEMQDKEE